MRSRFAIGLILLLCACGSSANMNAGDGGGNGGAGGSGGSGGSGGGTGGNGSGDMTGGGGSGGTGGGGDMSAEYGCNEILSCITMCGATASKTCTSMCRNGATQMGRGLYQSLQGCLREACYPHPDAATEPCSQAGAPTAQCTQCLSAAVAAGGACNSDYSACAAD